MSVKSKARHEGWLMIDHRASPGIAADVAHKLGLNPADVAEGALLEEATITCKHCGNAYRKNRYRIRARAYCKKCDHYICDNCDAAAAQADYVHRCKEDLAAKVLDAAEHGHTFDPLTPATSRIIIP